MARSPLIMGGDLRKLDQPTLDLLTNDEVLAINQHSSNNRPHFLADGWNIWTADAAQKGAHYLAIFNTADKDGTFSFDLGRIGLTSVKVRDLWARQDLGLAESMVTTDVPLHGVKVFGLSA